MSGLHPGNWRPALGPDVFPALSLRQPWAWAVVHAGKDIENRRWSTKFRGEFLIHAAKGLTRLEYLDARDYIEDELDNGGPPTGDGVPPIQQMVRGGFVGIARVVDVIPPCQRTNELLLGICNHKWHMPEQYGFRLADVRPLPFYAWSGALGFFGVPLDIARPLIARAA